MASWPRSRSCVTKVAARVERMEQRGRFSKRSLHVSELRSGAIPGGAGGGGHVEVRLLDSDPLYNDVLLGDRVTLSYWKGEVRTVRHGALTQETEDSPANTWRVPVGIGFLATPFGLIMLLMSWSYRNHHPNELSTAPSWPFAGVLTLLGSGVVGSFVSRDADHVQQVFLAAGIAAAVCAVLSLPLAWTMAWMQRRAADTSDVVPVRLAAPLCVAAEVYGEVPYSIDEFRFLLLGAGPPAVTSVPVEWSTPQQLPASLAIQEVRSFRPGDPTHWPSTYQYDGIVIECLDGEQVVLIACGRRDAPLILGALIHDRSAVRPWGMDGFGGTSGRAGLPGDPAPA
ncbi:hypothetical protein [Streptomyces sp. YIM 130001]|uniref:hypothetical protein n=1 Tax=Streptomyces sp. YIM 130001 TaxID=2259644 RepID=UPI0013C4DB70|nr:hypothetical protein [Streptomyces sp. YIM 130001]